MSEIKISVRYARALYEFALENKILEPLYNDMVLVEKTCHDSHELMSVFQSSIIKESRKLSIIHAVFSAHIHPITQKFLEIITKGKRVSLIKSIAKQFIMMYMDYHDIEKAHVTTAEPLDDNSRKRLIELLESQLKSKIKLEESIDNSLIGGLVLRLGDHQFDASIKNKIERLSKEFDSNLYVKEF